MHSHNSADSKEHRLAIPYIKNSCKVFENLLTLPYPIFFDSCSDLRKQQGTDIFCAAPSLVFIAQQDNYQILNSKLEEIESGTNSSKRLLEFEKQNTGSLMGYIGYHARDKDFRISPEKQLLLPDICLGVYPWRVESNHKIKESHLFYADNTFANEKELQRLIETLNSTTENSNPSSTHIENSKANFSFENYEKAFKKIKDYINEGDCYQVNLAQRFVSDFNGSVWQHYLKLREKSPAPFGCFLSTPYGDILSFSPESFLKINAQGEIISQPIKGTRKRSNDTRNDQSAKEQLANSQKDKAENLMIVDLIRNDLSKSAELNTVKVDELFKIQSFSNVHHMVSQVRAQKRPDLSYLEVLLNAFPGGSITGAPKKRAMEIINELEPDSREVYCGAIGYITGDNNMEFNIAIRTLVIHKNKLYCWGGGGIVADSLCEEEYQESINKISNLINITNTLD